MAPKGSYQLSLVKKLSFVRFGGTAQELRAANILMDEINSAGGKGEIKDFLIPAYNAEKYAVTVTEPYEKAIECVPYGRSGSFPEGGKELDLIYLERGTEEDYLGLGDLSGCAVMINSLNYDAYKLLVKHNAGAFIVINGKYYDDPNRTDLVPRALRKDFLEMGRIPGFIIRAKDAMNLVRRSAKKVRLELDQTEFENTSRNVVAVLPGTEEPDDIIVLTAHYDSVLVGTGSWDNATGAAQLMYIYRHFLKNAPRRTMYFIWCGSEEQGLFGSKAFIQQNPDLMPSVKFCFNFDMCGTILGPNNIKITGGDDLFNLTQQFCHEVGFSAELRRGVHSSDSAPFADEGVPAIGISRGTSTADIHIRYDLIDILSASELYKLGEFSIKLISRIVNSAILPVKTGMDDKMKEELDKYFLRDKKKAENK